MPRRKISTNFQNGPRATVNLPIIPSEWEMLLKKIDVPEEQAISHIETGTVAGKTIRLFVRAYGKRKFVPEPVLDLVGVIPDAGREWSD